VGSFGAGIRIRGKVRFDHVEGKLEQPGYLISLKGWTVSNGVLIDLVVFIRFGIVMQHGCSS